MLVGLAAGIARRGLAIALRHGRRGPVCASPGRSSLVWADVLHRLTASRRVRRWVIPLVRAYLRHVPLAVGKEPFWSRVVDPYLAWHSYPFVAPTIFGARMAGDTRDMLQQYVYYFGVWEPDLTRYVTRSLVPGDVFIDVGANVGYYSLLASRLVGPAGRVVAVEASPRTFLFLQDNLRRNRTANVRTINVAASDSTGTVNLFRGAESNIGETTVVARSGFVREANMPAAPLSTLLAAEEVQRARLVKIDVEGAEAAVVRGLAAVLDSCRSDLELVVELHPRELAQLGHEPEDVIGPLAGAGFHAYQLVNDYSVSSCIGQSRPRVPVRARDRIQAETLVVFSRQDTEALGA